MLDDFLGVVFREPEEKDEGLLQRGRRAAVAFDQELIKVVIAKQVRGSEVFHYRDASQGGNGHFVLPPRDILASLIGCTCASISWGISALRYRSVMG